MANLLKVQFHVNCDKIRIMLFKQLFFRIQFDQANYSTGQFLTVIKDISVTNSSLLGKKDLMSLKIVFGRKWDT